MSTKKTVLPHRDSQEISVCIEQLPLGKNKISVSRISPHNKTYIPYTHWETSYSIPLIQKILDIKGPAYLCDEIMRDESPNYLQKSLEYSLLSYENKNNFMGKRILDFGCGSGSSSMIIARMLPQVKIIGIDLDKKLLDLAQLRAKHYKLDNISFFHSQDPKNIPSPDKLGKFDYVILSAVYEHLKPQERKNLLPQLWDILNPNGVLFINRTPYRYFPIEIHTTGGLPFINYFPNKLTHWCAQHFSKKNLKNNTWDSLLRKGIRGASAGEILRILQNTQNTLPTQKNFPLLLKPSHLEIHDRIDLWYRETNTKQYKFIKKSLFWTFKILKKLTSITLVPTLSLAIKKSQK